MLKFEHTEVVGWEAAIRGMRNPLESWEKSDTTKCHILGELTEENYKSRCAGCKNEFTERPNCFVVGKNDLDLMTRLRNAGTDHRKFMRMITVYVDITGPLYWWKEFDTYKVGTVANSCSTMHCIHKKEFALEDFSYEHLSDFSVQIVMKQTIDALNYYRREYLRMVEKLKRTDLTDAEKKHAKSQQKYFWWQMIQLLPSSYNQKRTVMMNYEVLANIAKEGSRRFHKQDEWRMDFMNWIKSLPYSELIMGEPKETLEE